MDDYTTILVKKKTRNRLARLKRYRRESYDEQINDLLSTRSPQDSGKPKAAARERTSQVPDSAAVKKTLERLACLRANARMSDQEVEALMRQVEEEGDREALHVP